MRSWKLDNSITSLSLILEVDTDPAGSSPRDSSGEATLDIEGVELRGNEKKDSNEQLAFNGIGAQFDMDGCTCSI